MVLANRCHRQNMKTSIINGSEVSRLSVAIQKASVSKSIINGIFYRHNKNYLNSITYVNNHNLFIDTKTMADASLAIDYPSLD